MAEGLKALVIDFGGQYAHLIARRCRELGVYSETVEPEDAFRKLDEGGFGAIILSGGPRSVLQPDSPEIDLVKLLSYDIPILGICYGHQLIAKILGGEIRAGGVREYGRTLVKILEKDMLLDGLPDRLMVWMSHGDAVTRPPREFKATSVSEDGAITSMTDGSKIYSTQFHPEVTHTQYGNKILENFLRRICGIEAWWSPGDRVKELIDEIRSKVGADERVICAVSGGVDSVTTATIVSKAVGDRLYCIFVDHGLMRKGEVEQVKNSLRRIGVRNLRIVDARERFLSKLKGVEDPEEKRRIIGEEFIRVFEEEAKKISGIRWLAQGTIYPDRVESGRTGRKVALIKSHHNVGALPKRMNLKLLEPLRDF